jgi:hypothetical protein
VYGTPFSGGDSCNKAFQSFSDAPNLRSIPAATRIVISHEALTSNAGPPSSASAWSDLREKFPDVSVVRLHLGGHHHRTAGCDADPSSNFVRVNACVTDMLYHVVRGPTVIDFPL